MAPSLYYSKLSPPVRSVLLTARALDLQLDLKFLDMANGEHKKPEYLKLNPFSTVPTLDDDGLVIFDSHAICGYLVNQYGKDKHDSLYPRDWKKRAIVDQRMYFECGILFPRIRGIAFPIFFGTENTISEEKKEGAKDAYQRFNTLIGSNAWISGDQMTIADICCVTTISSLDELVPMGDDYPNTKAWLQRCKTTIPGYDDINADGAKQLAGALRIYMQAKS